MRVWRPSRSRRHSGRVSDDPVRRRDTSTSSGAGPSDAPCCAMKGSICFPGLRWRRWRGSRPPYSCPPVRCSPEFSVDMIEEFRDTSNQAVTIDHPVVKAAVLVLGEQFPQAVPFDDLWPAAPDRVSSAGLPTSDYGEPERRRLAAFLLQGYGSDWLELHSHMAPFVREPGERPATTPLARHQARSGGEVANLRHETVDLSRFDRHLLGLLDGHRTHSELVDALDALVTEGKLTIRGSDPGPLDTASRRAIVAESLRQGLARLAGRALLVA